MRATLTFFAKSVSIKKGKKGYPKFQKNNRSVEYKHSGWKLSEDRDINAAINILKKGLSTVGHTGAKAWGDLPAGLVGDILLGDGESMNQESLTPLG